MKQREKQNPYGVRELMRRIDAADFDRIVSKIDEARQAGTPCEVAVLTSGGRQMFVSPKKLQEVWLMVEARSVLREAKQVAEVFRMAGVPKNVIDRLDQLYVRDECIRWQWGSISTLEFFHFGESCSIQVCAWRMNINPKCSLKHT